MDQLAKNRRPAIVDAPRPTQVAHCLKPLQSPPYAEVLQQCRWTTHGRRGCLLLPARRQSRDSGRGDEGEERRHHLKIQQSLSTKTYLANLSLSGREYTAILYVSMV